MVVPPYCRTRAGRVFRLERSTLRLAPDRVQYLLRALPIGRAAAAPPLTVSREIDVDLLRDKLANRQAIPTPEDTFDALFDQLRRELDARDDA